MAADWNLETVADSKPQAPPDKPSQVAAPATASTVSADQSLGKVMVQAREARGFSREQAAAASSIPGYYLTMIETDDYSSIADQLYLLPFLRRYARFVGLDPEEVASRFVRDVQRADMNPVRMSEPIAIIASRKGRPWSTLVATASAAILLGAVGWFGYRHFMRKSAVANSKAPVAAEQMVPEAAEAAPEKIVPAPMPPPVAAVAPGAASAPPIGASAPKPAARAVAPASSSASAARPRLPDKSH